MNKESQSIFDFLINLMPNQTITKPSIDPFAAQKLFNVWKEESSQINDLTFRKPMTLSSSDVESMKKAELIEILGDRIKITSKGKDVIKTMILGDDSSIFDKPTSITYHQALSNTKNGTIKNATKIAQKVDKPNSNKKYEDLWWSRFECEQ